MVIWQIYAFFGLATTPLSYLVYLAVEGFAWSLMAVSYMVTVLGDLSSGFGSKERFYALGGIIPLIMVMSFSGVSDLFNLNAPAGALSSALSILLFVSVIPILRASETLPETKARVRRMREYVKKVGKLVQESKKPE